MTGIDAPRLDLPPLCPLNVEALVWKRAIGRVAYF